MIVTLLLWQLRINGPTAPSITAPQNIKNWIFSWG
jgi:hypothetical protein